MRYVLGILCLTLSLNIYASHFPVNGMAEVDSLGGPGGTKKGNSKTLPFYLTVSGTFGVAHTNVTSESSKFSERSRVSYGAGTEIVIYDNETGRLPLGIYYQVSGLSVLQLHYLKVPFQYQAYVGPMKRFFVGGGGYGGLLIGSSQTVKRYNLDGLNKTDAGVMVSTGYWITLYQFQQTARWTIQLSAQWGLTDIHPTSTLDKNGLYFLTISFAPSAGRTISGAKTSNVIKVNR